MAGRARRAQWLSLALSTAAAAAPPVTSPPPAAAPVRLAPAGSTAADAGLLLYLSEFEDAEGDWIDPAELPPVPQDSGDEDDGR